MMLLTFLSALNLVLVVAYTADEITNLYRVA